MDLIKQFGIILGLNYIGDIIQHVLDIPIPGNVIGFVLLFLLLTSKILKPKDIEKVINVILMNLAFLFVPAGASLITSLDILKDSWFQLLFISIASTILTMGVTGWVVQSILRRGDK